MNAQDPVSFIMWSLEVFMFVVGLTGSIGSGKTIVANLFAERGVPIIDADLIARELTEPHQLALTEITRHFGKEILNAEGELRRDKLRLIIFKDQKEKVWLEQLLHPLIIEKIKWKISQLNSPYCITVIPLLLEAGRLPFIDRILVVDTQEKTQIERVIARDKLQKDEVLSILKTQINRDARLALAEDVILNDGLISDLEPQVEKLHKLYTNISSP